MMNFASLFFGNDLSGRVKKLGRWWYLNNSEWAYNGSGSCVILLSKVDGKEYRYGVYWTGEDILMTSFSIGYSISVIVSES